MDSVKEVYWSTKFSRQPKPKCSENSESTCRRFFNRMNSIKTVFTSKTNSNQAICENPGNCLPPPQECSEECPGISKDDNQKCEEPEDTAPTEECSDECPGDSNDSDQVPEETDDSAPMEECPEENKEACQAPDQTDDSAPPEECPGETQELSEEPKTEDDTVPECEILKEIQDALKGAVCSDTCSNVNKDTNDVCPNKKDEGKSDENKQCKNERVPCVPDEQQKLPCDNNKEKNPPKEKLEPGYNEQCKNERVPCVPDEDQNLPCDKNKKKKPPKEKVEPGYNELCKNERVPCVPDEDQNLPCDKNKKKKPPKEKVKKKPKKKCTCLPQSGGEEASDLGTCPALAGDTKEKPVKEKPKKSKQCKNKSVPCVRDEQENLPCDGEGKDKPCPLKMPPKEKPKKKHKCTCPPHTDGEATDGGTCPSLEDNKEECCPPKKPKKGKKERKSNKMPCVPDEQKKLPCDEPVTECSSKEDCSKPKQKKPKHKCTCFPKSKPSREDSKSKKNKDKDDSKSCPKSSSGIDFKNHCCACCCLLAEYYKESFRLLTLKSDTKISEILSDLCGVTCSICQDCLNFLKRLKDCIL